MPSLEVLKITAISASPPSRKSCAVSKVYTHRSALCHSPKPLRSRLYSRGFDSETRCSQSANSFRVVIEQLLHEIVVLGERRNWSVLAFFVGYLHAFSFKQCFELVGGLQLDFVDVQLSHQRFFFVAFFFPVICYHLHV